MVVQGSAQQKTVQWPLQCSRLAPVGEVVASTSGQWKSELKRCASDDGIAATAAARVASVLAPSGRRSSAARIGQGPSAHNAAIISRALPLGRTAPSSHTVDEAIKRFHRHQRGRQQPARVGGVGAQAQHLPAYPALSSVGQSAAQPSSCEATGGTAWTDGVPTRCSRTRSQRSRLDRRARQRLGRPTCLARSCRSRPASPDEWAGPPAHACVNSIIVVGWLRGRVGGVPGAA